MTMYEDELDELIDDAHEAADADRYLEAAFLYERARVAAKDSGLAAEAFALAQRAAHAWYHADDYTRALSLLLELVREVPEGVDPWIVYAVHRLRFWVALDISRMDTIVEALETACLRVRSLCAEPSDEAYLQSELHTARGNWQPSLDLLERAWLRVTGDNSQVRGIHIAEDAGATCLQLNRLDAALGWQARIGEADDCHDQRLSLASLAVSIALATNDAAAGRQATLRLDDVLTSTQVPTSQRSAARFGCYALLLDPANGDPASPLHVAVQRLDPQPPPGDCLDFVAYHHHKGQTIIAIAALRYAAGMDPVDDVYYWHPQVVRGREHARLPTEIAARVQAARTAGAAMLPSATTVDERFQSTAWRADVDALRSRTEEIAAAFGL